MKHTDSEKNTFTVQFKDDWEYRMNKLGEKTTDGIFVPCHFTGVLSGLLNKDCWYRIVQHRNEKNEYSIIEYFPV